MPRTTNDNIGKIIVTINYAVLVFDRVIEVAQSAWSCLCCASSFHFSGFGHRQFIYFLLFLVGSLSHCDQLILDLLPFSNLVNRDRQIPRFWWVRSHFFFIFFFLFNTVGGTDSFNVSLNSSVGMPCSAIIFKRFKPND